MQRFDGNPYCKVPIRNVEAINFRKAKVICMAMEINGTNSGITSQIMDLKTSTPGVTRKEEIKTGFKNTKDYSKYLQEKYSYMNTGKTSMQGVPTTVSVSDAFLKKCMDNPEKAAWLEENMAAIPKCNEIALSRCLGKVTNICYKIDANGNMTMAISGTSDPDGKIARENAQRKAEEKKAAEEKTAKRRTEKKEAEEKLAEKRAEKASEKADKFEIVFTGSSVKSITQIMTERMMSGNTFASMVSGFDMKV